MNLDKDKLVYNGGSMTTFGARDFCLKVNDMIEGAGLSVYTPSNNKKINSKEDVGNKDIARMIVAKDSEAIINADVRVFNGELTTGTLIETGQVLGMNDMSVIIMKTIEKMESLGHDDTSIKDILWNICQYERNKDFVLYDTDIRYHEQPEAGYRRSTFKHQYQRGVGMKLMNNQDGFIRFDTLQDTLSIIGQQTTEDVYNVKMDDDGNIESVKNIFE
ncbi:MAG: hypothetical protein L0L52_05085 [Staphylococcus equorum]|nr:hypothetical protein [Staphylococcus equorum]